MAPHNDMDTLILEILGSKGDAGLAIGEVTDSLIARNYNAHSASALLLNALDRGTVRLGSGLRLFSQKIKADAA